MYDSMPMQCSPIVGFSHISATQLGRQKTNPAAPSLALVVTAAATPAPLYVIWCSHGVFIAVLDPAVLLLAIHDLSLDV
ncbi:hypothetical protein BD626DRAFT_578077 [Schizophyllum amplum]|uniref:Uncharacterized protein n=1 Tax=Schizophyllum amplum TaxID=97359 RepID=A0A550BS73_9AGAR|nr:hypothetical protein BD626DRAFT_578077 [Auriculariopsis ampla]